MQANQIGEMEAACHCGTVRFRVKLTDGFNTARRCTCSYCRMRGAVAVSADIGGITFDAGEEALTIYRFNTGAAQHYFCSRCGTARRLTCITLLLLVTELILFP